MLYCYNFNLYKIKIKYKSLTSKYSMKQQRGQQKRQQQSIEVESQQLSGNQQSKKSTDSKKRGKQKQQDKIRWYRIVQFMQVMVYIYSMMVSVLFLQYFYFNQYIPNASIREIIQRYIPFLFIACVASYHFAVRTDPRAPIMKGLPIRHEQYYRYDQAYRFDKKYCNKCKRWKLPRMSHCSTCQSCIYRMDHHCRWTQNCATYSNYHAFFMFMFYMLIGVIMFLASSFYAIYDFYTGCHFFSYLPWYIYLWWFVTLISAIGGLIFISGMLLSHAILMSTNLTTLDGLKKGRACSIPICEFRYHFLNDQMVNIYDRGEIQNFKRFIGGSSLFHFLIPRKAHVQNDFVVDLMHPYPSQYNIQKCLPDEVQTQFMKKRKIRTKAKNCLKALQGKKLKIKGRIIEL